MSIVEPIIEYTLGIYKHIRVHLTADVRRRREDAAKARMRICGQGISRAARRVSDFVGAAQRELENLTGESLGCLRNEWRRARSRVTRWRRAWGDGAWGDGERAGVRPRSLGKPADPSNEDESLEWIEGSAFYSDDDDNAIARADSLHRRPGRCYSMSMRGGAGSPPQDVSFGDGARAGAITPPPIDPGTPPPPELTEAAGQGGGAEVKAGPDRIAAVGAANGAGGGMDIKSQLEALTANILQNTLPLLERVTSGASLQREERKGESSGGVVTAGGVASGSSPLERDDAPGAVNAEEAAEGANDLKVPPMTAGVESASTSGAATPFRFHAELPC